MSTPLTASSYIDRMAKVCADCRSNHSIPLTPTAKLTVKADRLLRVEDADEAINVYKDEDIVGVQISVKSASGSGRKLTNSGETNGKGARFIVNGEEKAAQKAQTRGGVDAALAANGKS